MELKIQIDGILLQDKVEDFLKNLTEDQLSGMVSQMLTNTMAEFDTQMDNSYVEAKALAKVREINSYYKKDSDEQIKRSSEFNRAKEQIASYKNTLITNLIDKAIVVAKEEIVKEVTSNEAIKTVISQTLEVVKAEFPTYIKNAMTMYLAQQMQNTLNSVMLSTQEISNNNNLLQNINQRLANKGI